MGGCASKPKELEGSNSNALRPAEPAAAAAKVTSEKTEESKEEQPLVDLSEPTEASAANNAAAPLELIPPEIKELINPEVLTSVADADQEESKEEMKVPENFDETAAAATDNADQFQKDVDVVVAAEKADQVDKAEVAEEALTN